MRAVRTLTTATDVFDAGFAGSAALVDADGTVDHQTFDAFANGVASATGVRTVGYAPVVADDGRAAFEQRLGGSITEVGPTGTLQPAATRPAYTPVAWSYPIVESAAQVAGFDLSSDDVRRSTLAVGPRQREHLVLRADPSPARWRDRRCSSSRRCTGRARRSRRRRSARANVVGYITASVTGDVLVQQMLAEAGSGVRLQLTDDGAPLAATAAAAHRRPSGARWSAAAGRGSSRCRRDAGAPPQRADQPAAPRCSPPWLIGLAAAAQPAQDRRPARQRAHGAGARSAQRAPRRGGVARRHGRRDRHVRPGGRGRAAGAHRPRRPRPPAGAAAPWQRGAR